MTSILPTSGNSPALTGVIASGNVATTQRTPSITSVVCVGCPSCGRLTVNAVPSKVGAVTSVTRTPSRM